MGKQVGYVEMCYIFFTVLQDIDVEFDFRNMTEGDYHGIKSLLSQLAHGSLSTLTQLTSVISDQVNIGCAVTTGDEDSGVCAFGTIVNIRQHKSNPGVVDLYALLTDIAKRNPSCTRGISHIQTNPAFVVGLMLKERLINFPPELAPNIHKVLVGDVEWSCSDDYEPDDSESRSDYAFTTLLFLSTFEMEGNSKQPTLEEGESQPPASDLGHRKRRKMEKKAKVLSRVYHHWEDEVFIEKALFSHAWQNTSKPPVIRGNKKYSSYSILYALKWSEYIALVGQLAQMAT